MKTKLILATIFIVFVILGKIYKIDTYITLENIKEQQYVLNLYIENNYILSVIIFIIIYILSMVFLLPIATLLTLSGGMLFGFGLGTVFVNIGATTGAIGAFLFARYIMGEQIQQKYTAQLTKFNAELEINKYQYLFSLRFLPIFPFFLVNFLCGVTKIDLKTFIITTSLGIIPGSFVFTYAGSQIANIYSINDIFTKNILLAFILLGILTLMPIIIKKTKSSLYF